MVFQGLRHNVDGYYIDLKVDYENSGADIDVDETKLQLVLLDEDTGETHYSAMSALPNYDHLAALASHEFGDITPAPVMPLEHHGIDQCLTSIAVSELMNVRVSDSPGIWVTEGSCVDKALSRSGKDSLTLHLGPTAYARYKTAGLVHCDELVFPTGRHDSCSSSVTAYMLKKYMVKSPTSGIDLWHLDYFGFYEMDEITDSPPTATLNQDALVITHGVVEGTWFPIILGLVKIDEVTGNTLSIPMLEIREHIEKYNEIFNIDLSISDLELVDIIASHPFTQQKYTPANHYLRQLSSLHSLDSSGKFLQCACRNAVVDSQGRSVYVREVREDNGGRMYRKIVHYNPEETYEEVHRIFY